MLRMKKNSLGDGQGGEKDSHGNVVAGAMANLARFRGGSQLRDPRVLAADPAVVPESVVSSALEHFRAIDMKKRLPADADMLTVRLPEGLLERTKIRAIKEKATLQSLVAAALENYLKQRVR
jgi:hypothetical protein